MGAQMQGALKEELLKRLIEEPVSVVRNSVASLVAQIAKVRVCMCG